MNGDTGIHSRAGGGMIRVHLTEDQMQLAIEALRAVVEETSDAEWNADVRALTDKLDGALVHYQNAHPMLEARDLTSEQAHESGGRLAGNGREEWGNSLPVSLPPRSEEAHDVADVLGARVAKLGPEQQNLLLWRLVYGHAPAVQKAIAELDNRGWRL